MMVVNQWYRYTVSVRREVCDGGEGAAFIADPDWGPVFVHTEFNQSDAEATIIGANATHIEMIKRLMEKLIDHVALAKKRAVNGDE